MSCCSSAYEGEILLLKDINETLGHSIEGRVLDLHLVNPGLISGIPYGPQSPPGVIPKHRGTKAGGVSP